MKYKLVFDVVLVKKYCTNSIKFCDLETKVADISVTVSLIFNKMPTCGQIDKIVETIKKPKDEKILDKYFINVKLSRTEVVG